MDCGLDCDQEDMGIAVVPAPGGTGTSVSPFSLTVEFGETIEKGAWIGCRSTEYQKLREASGVELRASLVQLPDSPCPTTSATSATLPMGG
jgi:hypothetical protein